MSYEPVADGQLAAVVTFLEMRAPPTTTVPPSDLRLVPLDRDLEAYRDLFRRVGARWLWFSRLVMSDERLRAIFDDPEVEFFAVESARGEQVGLLELDFRERGACELAFVGLVPERSGHGHGRWLLAEALQRAWRPDVERVHVHTCSLDHPAALPAYLRAGFIPVRRAIERFPDPRLLGLLPRDCAPQVPLVGAASAGTPSPAS